MRVLKLILIVTCCCLISTQALAEHSKRAMPRLFYTIKRPKVKTPNPQAKIINMSFQRTSPERGIWRGAVKGNGEISLFLQIFENGALYSTRYIGHVQQKLNERPTPFKFISAVPTTRTWTWKITAKAS